MNLLLVEDDLGIITSLTEYLKIEGFEVDHTPGQRETLEKLKESQYDLILLDISLENGNGFEICKYVKKNYDMPVIFLTASGDEGSVVTGLDIGADDYVAKPFRPRELMSRIKNAMRKYESSGNQVRLGNVFVDTDRGLVSKNGLEISLSALEYKLLQIFIANRGRLLSRNKLLEDIWDIAGDYVNDNTLTVYIKRLREKIEDDPGHPKIIKTVRGLGYRVD